MEYKRYQGKSYMICSVADGDFGYETPMLTENSIPGILSAHIAYADDTLQFWYDISGRQTLEDWLAIKKAGSVFLRKLITALAEAVMQAGEFLLAEEGISLKPEHIFVDMEEKEIAFCYMPFDKTHFQQGLNGLMEYYLSHMEHGTGGGVQKCYDVYEKCQQEYVDLEELLAILYTNSDAGQAVTQPQKEPECEPDLKAEKPCQKEAACSETKRKQKTGRFILGLFGKKEQPFFAPLAQKKESLALKYPYEPKEYQKEGTNPTVFLGSETDQMFGELKYEGNGTGENLPITADCYLIGSKGGEVDGIISDETVSRIHARITKEEDSYYLEDLNSTNGTFRNGEPLKYKERVKLQKNDRITFAQVCYRFV